MLAPEVASEIMTFCVLVYVPATGRKVGVAAADVVPPATYFQVLISCCAVEPPVPAVKPTFPVLEPIVVGMSMAQDLVKVCVGTAVSVMVMAKVAPS